MNTNTLTAGIIVVSNYLDVTAWHNVVSISNSVNVVSAIESNSITSGALIVNGGVGIGGNVYVGRNLRTSNFLISNSTINSINTTGALSVGRLNLSTGGFITVGSIYSTNAVVTSDYRIKSNVRALDGNVTVSKLNPVQYYNLSTKKDEFGFLAHEVQQIFPDLVVNEKDGEHLQAMNYTGLIGLIVKEIQTLKKENIEIREELKNIKEKINM